MDQLDDAIGEIVNVGFDIIKNNFNLTLTNMPLLNLLLLGLLTDKPFPKTSDCVDKVYDYIIVGGGTAGSVMANRLSQKPCVKVLLLEAGGYAPILTEIPALGRLLFYGTNIDWAYKTVPQKNCAFGQIDNRVIWNSGRALGGSSIINAMIYARGNHKNYDNWADDGCTGWSYDEVLPYLKKLEDVRGIHDGDLDPGYHGTDGPMTIEKPNYEPEIKQPILKSLAELGFNVLDINGKRGTGLYDIQGTIRNGQRCSTAKAYLVPAEDRPNLTILKRAFVTRILIRNNTAHGVEFDFESKGNIKRVFARKEVILSTGTIRSPQLLMLSGIGPKKHLRKFKIPVVADLPVGKNLHDHYVANMYYTVDSTIPNAALKLIYPVNIWKYFKERSGPLASSNQCTVLAFLDGLNTTATSSDFPKQELYFAEYGTMDAFKNINIKSEVYNQVFAKYALDPMYLCMVSILQPKSRGKILLNSLDPYDHPMIDPNFYKDEDDLKVMVEGMKICQAVASRPAMKKVGAKPIDTIFPGCEEYVGDNDKYLRCQAKTVITTNSHYVGTARMGQPDDPRSVVDCRLRVIGVKNLRVVSAAVMPIVPSGNINVPTMMVAERVYDMMKDDMKCEDEVDQDH